jgi:hypothetical protein
LSFLKVYLLFVSIDAKVKMNSLNSPDEADILAAQRRDKGDSRKMDGWQRPKDSLLNLFIFFKYLMNK